MPTIPGQFLTDLTEGEYLERMVGELDRVGFAPERIEKGIRSYVHRAGLRDVTITRNGQRLTIAIPGQTIIRTITRPESAARSRHPRPPRRHK